MKDKVLIDTSVWIAYLQGTAPEKLQQLVDRLLDMKDIVVPKIVLAEKSLLGANPVLPPKNRVSPATGAVPPQLAASLQLD